MDVLKKILSPLASLKLTVALLAMTMIVIFTGTAAQKELGIWDVQHRIFHTWIAFIDLKYFFPLSAWGWENVRGRFPAPGGYTLIVALLANLLAAHTVRFKLNLKRSGIFLIHIGLIMLLVGELVTSTMAKEAQMPLVEGQSANWVHDIRAVELAIVDTTSPGEDRHVVIPESKLKAGGTIENPALPFAIRVDRFHPNTEIFGPQQAESKEYALATAGAGVGIGAKAKPVVSGTEGQNIDIASAFVTPLVNGNPAGTFLVSAPVWRGALLSKLNDPQTVEANGRTYQMQLRFVRHYKPYTVQLVDFTHDKYIGTSMAKNFASRVRLIDPANNVDREVVVRMNEPLRYRGDTLFQASFDPENDRATTLQVVRNPGWVVPYVACVVGAVGMLIHFGIVLFNFLRRQGAQGNLSFRNVTGRNVSAPPPLLPASPGSGGKAGRRAAGATASMASYTLQPKSFWLNPTVIVPIAVALLGVVYMAMHAFPASYNKKGGPDLDALARVPVNFDGRTLPLDTLARNSLKIVSGKESFKDRDGQRVYAIQWLADVLAGNERSREYRVFRIVHPEVRGVLGLATSDIETANQKLPPERRRDVNEKMYSWNDIFNGGGGAKLQTHVDKARQTDVKSRDAFQTQVIELYKHLTLYLRLASAPEAAELYDLLQHPGEAQALDAQVRQLASSGVSPRDLAPEQREALQKYERMTRQVNRIDKHLSDPEGAADDLYFAAPGGGWDNWHGLGLSVKDFRDAGKMSPAATAWMGLINDLRLARPSDFNANVKAYLGMLQARVPADVSMAGTEVFFNRFDAFWTAIWFYVAALIFACLSWAVWGKGFGRTAWMVVLLALGVHTFGLLLRMYISGRPPVTNLYSSALFIGWGGVVLCLILEFIFRNRTALAMAALLGFAPLLVANGIAFSDAVTKNQADTMAQLQAVLDTNFWLATHVVIITLGYAAVFLAGTLATAYVLAGVFFSGFHAALRKDIARMVYGILCFAMIFSFVGTILGGIWADQSWGRFWGWDPKENGAILIVVWVALVLHARWGGVVRERGVMNLAIFGNVVTVWSWFGTNMMGVGLHAYGFMDSEVWKLGAYVAFNVAVIGTGMLPLKLWKSVSDEGNRLSPLLVKGA